MSIKTQEKFNFYSHLTGAVLSFAGLIFLVLAARGSMTALITALIYGLSIVFLFTASSLYHAFKKKENELSFWRKMDRMAIFFMIAGTYTPVSYFYLEGNWRWIMIGLQWGLVGFGVFSQVFFPRAPRGLYAFIYLFMGWLAIFPIKQIVSRMSAYEIFMLFGGGIAFTLGGLVYAIKRPRILPGIFSFHELFHITVLVGGSFHYAMICNAYFRVTA